METFPVLNAPSGCAKTVPLVQLNDEHAYKVHSQSLKRLAERGGLCPEEIFLNKHKLKYGAEVDRDAAIKLVNEMNM